MTQLLRTAIDNRGWLSARDGELPRSEPVPALGYQMTSREAQSSRLDDATDAVPDFAELIGRSDDQLEELVLANLGPDATGLWQALLLPPLLDRVRTILIATQHRVDNDLRTRRSRRNERGSKLGFDPTSHYEQRYSQWRVRVTMFKRLVETRLSQTRAAAADENHKAAALNRRHRNAVRRLAEAIDRHRRTLGAEVDPEPADRALWQILEDVTVPLGPQGVPVAVRDMLTTYWSSAQKGAAMDAETTKTKSQSTTEYPAPWPEDLERFADAVRPTTKPNQDADGEN
ncbi:hypothetical protein GCM10027360_33000 [Amycolatopsis echigonensis]